MTNKRLKEILDSITIICDSREQENSHILDYFDKHGIKHISRKLDYGDYSFELPPISDIGFNEVTTFESRICVERKNSLDELSGNIAQSRERFERELQRAKENHAKLILMVEDGTYLQIMKHKYKTDLNERSYLASLFSFKARYGIEIEFIENKLSGWYMFQTFKYFLREELLNLKMVV